MARRYVRDKIGRFASHGGGGGSFGGGGKVGKSAKNVKARKAYKSASSKVRKAQRDFKIADKKSSAAGGARTRAANASAKARRAGKYTEKTAAKYQRAADKAYGASIARTKAAGKISGSKSGLTRVTNRLTSKRAAKSGLKETFASQRVAGRKATTAKKKTYKGLTPKQQYKAATSKARAAKSGYAQDRGQGYDRAGKVSGKGKVKRSMKLPGSDDPRYTGAAKAQVTKLQKKFGKGATKGKGYGVSKKGESAKSKFKDLKRQRGGVTKGRGTVEQRKKSLNVRTTQQAFGMKVKKPVSKAAQKYIGKQNVEASRVSAFRGKGSKAQRRAAEIKMTSSKANRGSASTKRDRILRTAKKNVMKSGGIKSAAFDRRVKRLQKAEDIMTEAMGGSTAWKNF